MDLKNGMKNLKENVTLRRILEILLAVGNFLNGAEVTSERFYEVSVENRSLLSVRWLSTRLSRESSGSERYDPEAFFTLPRMQSGGGEIPRYK
jgi:hypothetical protein